MRIAGSGTAADSGSAEGSHEPLPVPPADQSFRHQDMRREWGDIPRNPDNFPFDREVSLPTALFSRAQAGRYSRKSRRLHAQRPIPGRSVCAVARLRPGDHRRSFNSPARPK